MNLKATLGNIILEGTSQEFAELLNLGLRGKSSATIIGIRHKLPWNEWANEFEEWLAVKHVPITPTTVRRFLRQKLNYNVNDRNLARFLSKISPPKERKRRKLPWAVWAKQLVKEHTKPTRYHAYLFLKEVLPYPPGEALVQRLLSKTRSV